jgi:putative membrane protein
MRKLFLMSITALALGSLQACNSSKIGKNADTTMTTTDTSNMTNDSTAMMSDTSANSTMTENPDTAFANKAAAGGMAEVAFGKLALTKSSNAKIKDFATMMVNDHGKANTELMSIAESKKIKLPSGLDAEHQVKMDSLSKLSGINFDKAYVMAMVEGHNKTLSLMKTEATDGKDAELKAFAAKTAPTVQTHLDIINKIHNSMK